MRKTIGIAGVALGALLFTASEARADAVSGTGYVCRIAYSGPTSTFMIGPTRGQFGSIAFSVYSAPNCGGAFLQFLTLYSDGSTINNWTGGSGPLLSEAALFEMHRSLQSAAQSGQPVYYTGLSYQVIVGILYYQATYLRFASF
jgi:hypothetical protein